MTERYTANNNRNNNKQKFQCDRKTMHEESKTTQFSELSKFAQI